MPRLSLIVKQKEETLISFDEYYRNYLGLDQNKSRSGNIFPAERRSKSVAYFYLHHLISTVIDGKLIHSIAPQTAKEFGKSIIKNADWLVDTKLLREIDDVLFDILPPLSYSPMIMHRMTIDDLNYQSDSDVYDVIALTESSKRLFEKQSLQRGKKSTEFIWNARLETMRSGRYFAIIENDEIASSSFISDVDFQAANIVVSTNPKYRKKGYGKAVVARATAWCIQNEIRPIYLVDVRNEPSVGLAEGLGYKSMAKEIVISSYIGIYV